jgi:DNA replication protein DnaC
MSATALPEVVREGTEFVVRVRCQDCKREIVLRSDEEPNEIALRLALMYVCDECSTEEERRSEQAADAASFGKRFKASGMPEHARELRFQDMIASGSRAQAIDGARNWAVQKPRDARGLLLHGPAGTGKTRLAATAAVARLRQYPVAWVSVAMLIARLQASFSDKDRADALKVLTGAGALVLDDLDKVNPSETVRSQLFVAIENRVEAEAPLLITTNLPPAELEEKFGEAIVSRIAGFCLGRTFLMDGADRRLQLGEGEE